MGPGSGSCPAGAPAGAACLGLVGLAHQCLHPARLPWPSFAQETAGPAAPVSMPAESAFAQFARCTVLDGPCQSTWIVIGHAWIYPPLDPGNRAYFSSPGE